MFVPGEYQQEEDNLPRKRQRPVISCTECHRRKQKVPTKQQSSVASQRALSTDRYRLKHSVTASSHAFAAPSAA